MSKYLEHIQSPKDIKDLQLDQLKDLSAEIREEIIDLVSTKEGHLGASLGVVELTVALHYVFNAPNDSILWDVGHQAYGHKLLTGRKQIFHTNRQKDGMSGFPKREESEFDAFGVGHSSTSISAALGMALASQLQGDFESTHIAVIGDASIASGMAFEGLNHAGATQANLLVVLNDNAIGIDPSVGALKDYLTSVKMGINPKDNNMIKSLNFDYTGPIDGHDIRALVLELERLKRKKGPRFLHITTTKGKGLKQAEENQVLYHAPGKFDKATGDIIRSNEPSFPKYQDVFGKTLLEMATANEQIVAITPAMPSGSSLKYMMEVFPHRAIDVGIAEQHAVTLGAGLATKGLKVYACLYSTFLQRAYDQVIHDVALQNLPMVFCVDRAGLVGEDGATHQGVFDISYLNVVPNLTIWAPKDAKDLRLALYNSQYFSEGPLVIRYPRGKSNDLDWQIPFEKHTFSELELIQSGNRIAIISTGTIFEEVRKSLVMISSEIAHFHCTQIKPLPEDVMIKLKDFDEIITVEEGAVIGGFGCSLAHLFGQNNLSNTIHNLGVPDQFIEHATHQEQLEMCGLDANSIANYLSKFL